MNDHDLLDLLAAEAPEPAPDHAERLLLQARHTRHRRRRLQLLAGAGATAVVALIASLAVTNSAKHVVSNNDPATSPTVSRQQTDPAGPIPEPAIYAVVIRALGGEMQPRVGHWPVLYVVDHTCDNVAAPTRGKCDAWPLSAALRTGLDAGLASYGPVTFVPNTSAVTDSHDLHIVHGGILIALGPVQLNGRHAQVQVSIVHGGKDGRGATYQLTGSGNHWRITGNDGAAWIS